MKLFRRANFWVFDPRLRPVRADQLAAEIAEGRSRESLGDRQNEALLEG
jgi:hypothetical protein